MQKNFPVLDELPALVEVEKALTLRDYFALNASDGDIAQTQNDYLESYRKPLARADARYEFADKMLKARGSV